MDISPHWCCENVLVLFARSVSCVLSWSSSSSNSVSCSVFLPGNGSPPSYHISAAKHESSDFPRGGRFSTWFFFRKKTCSATMVWFSIMFGLVNHLKPIDGSIVSPPVHRPAAAPLSRSALVAIATAPSVSPSLSFSLYLRLFP